MMPLAPLEIALIQADIPERADTIGLRLWASVVKLALPDDLDFATLRTTVVEAVRHDSNALQLRQLVKGYRFGTHSVCGVAKVLA